MVHHSSQIPPRSYHQLWPKSHSASGRKTQCSFLGRTALGWIWPWTKSSGLQRCNESQSPEVTLADVISHIESRAAAQHVHMDMKPQSQLTPLACPHIINHSQVHSIRPQVCACSSWTCIVLALCPSVDKQLCSPSHSTHAQLDPVNQDLLPGRNSVVTKKQKKRCFACEETSSRKREWDNHPK